MNENSGRPRLERQLLASCSFLAVRGTPVDVTVRLTFLYTAALRHIPVPSALPFARSVLAAADLGEPIDACVRSCVKAWRVPRPCDAAQWPANANEDALLEDMREAWRLAREDRG